VTPAGRALPTNSIPCIRAITSGRIRAGKSKGKSKRLGFKEVGEDVATAPASE